MQVHNIFSPPQIRQNLFCTQFKALLDKKVYEPGIFELILNISGWLESELFFRAGNRHSKQKLSTTEVISSYFDQVNEIKTNNN